MSPEIISTILGALTSLLAAGLASTDLIRRLVRILLKREEPQKPYSERLAVLAELAQVAKDRAHAVQQLETDLAIMSGRERELKERIDALEKTPLAVAEHFAKLVAPGEKRSAMRDYLLFGAGVVVSTAIGIAIQVFVR
jgi:hypothetical protein